MKLFKLQFEIIDGDNPNAAHPMCYVQKAVSEQEESCLPHHLIIEHARMVQADLMHKMPELFDQINTQVYMTPEEIQESNLNDITNLLLTQEL